jgi:ABC-type uncharacterized transport system substrate-binding protein
MRVSPALLFSLFLGPTLFFTALTTAEAQQAGKIPRVGWIGNMAPPPPPATQYEGFRDGLRELGYIEGQNIRVEYRWAAGQLERLPDLVVELAGAVDVLVVGGQQGLDAAQRKAGATPVVLVACDPIETLIGSLSRPGGTITGLTCISSELASKRLELLKELIPRLARVAVLYNPGDTNKAVEVRQLDAAAKGVGVVLIPMPVAQVEQFENALAGMKRERAQALVTLADPFMNFHRRRIAEIVARYHLPAIDGFREYVDAGGLMSYGASLRWANRRSAFYVDRILKGVKPADLPIEQPTTFELVINLKTAKALGLTIPPSLLLRADQVIE